MITYKVKEELESALIILSQKLNKEEYSKVVSVMHLFYMGCSLGLGENPSELLMLSKKIYTQNKLKRPNARILKLIKK